MSTKHESALKSYYQSYFALLFFTALTVGVAYIDFGPFNIFIALTIAVVKAVIVTLIFMHLKHTSHLSKLFFGAALVWVVLVVTGFLPDYMTRNRPYEPNDPTWILKDASHFQISAAPATAEPSKSH